MSTELATAGVTAITQAATWNDALTPFLNVQNSPRTCLAYRRAVTEAMTVLGVTYPTEVTAPALAEYRAALVKRLDAKGAERLSPASVALKLAALRGFLKFCRMAGLLTLPLDVIGYTLSSPSAKVLRPYEVLTLDEQRRVMDALADRPRDRALVALALGAGLRVAELTAVRVRDFYTDDDGADWVLVKQGKGRKDRAVPLSPAVAAVIRAHVEAEALRPADCVFQSRQGESGQLTAARVWQIIKAAVRSAGIVKRISPHSMRHTYALGRLKAGASPVIVQKMLGHAAIGTTQKYLDHLEREDLRRWAATLPTD